MSWNYAELSKVAKNTGGPDALVDSLFNSGRIAGRADMTPWLAGSLALGCAASWGIPKLISFFSVRKANKKAKFEDAKQRIIQGINDYDAAHSVEAETATDENSLKERDG